MCNLLEKPTAQTNVSLTQGFERILATLVLTGTGTGGIREIQVNSFHYYPIGHFYVC